MALNCASKLCSQSGALSLASLSDHHYGQSGVCQRAPSALLKGPVLPQKHLREGMQWQARTSSLFAQNEQRRHRSLAGGIRAHTQTEAAEVDRSTCPKIKGQVDLNDFEKIDIRVGLVTDAKAIPDKEMTEKRGKPTMSRKYLQLKVDIGSETRTVVSECKYVMDVEDAVGKKVLFVANLPPTEVEGIQSHGLVLQGLNYDPTPMPRSFKVILPGLGKLPPGSPIVGASIPR